MRAFADRQVRAFLWWFTRLYGAILFWRHLDGIYVEGLERARATARGAPVILACNHTCWWDGIWSLKLNHWLGVEGRFFVAADNVERLTFLKLMGAISLNRTSLAAMAEAMEEGVTWLDRPGRSMVMFPQGRFRPVGVRPLGLQRGVQTLQRSSKAVIVPVSITMTPLDCHLPACLISFGEPIEPGGAQVLDLLETRLVEGLDGHQEWLDDLDRPPKFDVLVRSGVTPVEDKLGARVFGWMTRWFAGLSGTDQAPPRIETDSDASTD